MSELHHYVAILLPRDDPTRFMLAYNEDKPPSGARRVTLQQQALESGFDRIINQTPYGTWEQVHQGDAWVTTYIVKGTDA